MSGLQRGQTLILASHNSGKLHEFASLLAPYGLMLSSAAGLELDEPDETADSFEGNAIIKASAVAAATGKVALADDSGFCVAALGGRPGVHSARWGGPQRDFGLAMRRIHDEMGHNAATEAWFMCVLCLAWPEGATRTFSGRVDGRFCWPPRGENGHGYDPVFIPQGHDRSFAQMTDAEKNRISHRARAFALFRDECLTALEP